MEESIKAEEFEEDHSISADVEKPPPSFKGKLNMANFAFSPALKIKSESPTPSPSRRSPRLPIPESNKYSLQKPKRKSSTLTPSPSPKKKSRFSSGYAPPETYAHLPELQDVLATNLICIFIGLNPGIATATQGHAYAHPSNLFWKLLHSSGCTTRRCAPEEDGDLPRLFSLGNTNIVARPTRNGSELSKGEMDASVHILEEKIARYKSESVCIVGKSIWESIWRVKHGRKIKKEEFRYGWQDEVENMGVGEKWEGAKVFVACSTSGLAASLLPAQKEEIWKELGTFVEKRRNERAAAQVEQSL